MNKVYREIVRNVFQNTARRNIFLNARLNGPGAYEGEGKTTVHVLNNETGLGLMIDGYSEVGFRLTNEMTILGSMIIFPRSVLSWNVNHISELTEEAFSLLTILEPKIDILVLGIGDSIDNYNFYRKMLPFSKKFKIPFEVLPTERACATFNFLTIEGRNVVGAMIPPRHLKPTDDEELVSKLRYQNLYVTE